MRQILNIIIKAIKCRFYEKKYFCSVCNSKIYDFYPIGNEQFELLDKYNYIHSPFLAETHNRYKYYCPKCGATDRDRLYALYLKSNLNDDNIKLLDFAPSKVLSHYLKSNKNLEYRSADLFMDNVDDKVDITDMSIYNNEQFDFFLCSHILEHVKNDIRAIKELYRILNKKGKGILMVPINLGLKEIYENNEITEEIERIKHFGQKDHVRIYSKQGFIKRIESVDFIVNQFDINYFGREVFNKYGISDSSVLYVVTK